MEANEHGDAAPVPRPEEGRLRASDEDRRATESALSEAYATGRLDYTEFRERSDRAWKSVHTSDLQSLLIDVQPAPGAELATTAGTNRSVARAAAGTGPRFSFAMMSGQERSGSWTCPARHTVISTMGGVVIDLRKALFESEDTTITCICVMGGVDVIVPDDVDVEVGGLGIMGGFGATRELRETVARGRRARVRINGVAVMGGVGIRIKEDDGGEL